MTREQKTVWKAADGTELLTSSLPGKFYIPLGTIDEKTLRELRDACEDALSEPLIAAMKAAERGEVQ